MPWLLCLLATFVLSGQVVAQTPSQLANTFFAAVRAKDADGLRTLLDPSARIVTTAVNQGVPVVRSAGAADYISAASQAQTPWNQSLSNAQTFQDGNLAVVWARFRFQQDGQVRYCGKLAMQMVRSAAGWRITHIGESQRNPPCP